MDTRSDRGLSQTRADALDAGGSAWLPLVLELTLELPVSLARAVVTFAPRGWRRQRRDGIGLSTMSDDWLREFAAGERGRDDTR